MSTPPTLEFAIRKASNARFWTLLFAALTVLAVVNEVQAWTAAFLLTVVFGAMWARWARIVKTMTLVGRR